MIEKKEDDFVPLSPSEEVPSMPINATAFLAQSQQLLELTTCQVQAEIKASFARLMEALQSREKQLLRQVDVLQSQQLALLQSQQAMQTNCCKGDPLRPIPRISANLEEEDNIRQHLSAFGKINVEGGNLVAIEGSLTPYTLPYKVEEYLDAKDDHVSLYKSLSGHSSPQHVRFEHPPGLDSSEPPIINENTTEEKDHHITESKGSSSVPRRPSQVHQWLQQILAETETEPSIAEQEKNFSPISSSPNVINMSLD